MRRGEVETAVSCEDGSQQYVWPARRCGIRSSYRFTALCTDWRFSLSEFRQEKPMWIGDFRLRQGKAEYDVPYLDALMISRSFRLIALYGVPTKWLELFQQFNNMMVYVDIRGISTDQDRLALR